MEDATEGDENVSSYKVKQEFNPGEDSATLTEYSSPDPPQQTSIEQLRSSSKTAGTSPGQSAHQSLELGGDESPSFRRSMAPAAAAGGVSSNFIKVQRRGSYHNEQSEARRKAYQIISSPYVANFMVFVVMVDSYTTCADIDARAAGQDSIDPWLSIVSQVCLVLYTVEMVLLLSLRGLTLLKKDMLMSVDVVIIVCGYAEWILGQFFPTELLDLRLLRTLRFLRIIRLLRLLRKIHGLRELQKLVIMMATCLKALAWSFLFCFVIMTVWAMLLVEMVHPIISNLHQHDPAIFGDCDQCYRAASSVMHANLLLFKTVIAGDSWGLIAVPVIEAYPATAIIFMGSLLTIVFGVLNLIVAVVVDTFAEARERDVLNLAEEMERNHENDKKFLQKVFERIDEDGSGELTLDELVEGARKDPEFQSRLRVMDIDEVDLQQLFEMIDVDGSGSIEAAEFIAPLSRWVHDSKTAPRFIKYNMLRSMQQQDELYRLTHFQFTALSTRLEDLTEKVDSMASAASASLARPLGPRPQVPVMPVVGAGSSLFESLTSMTVSEPTRHEDAHEVGRTSVLHSELAEPTEPLDEIDHHHKLDEVASEHLDKPEQPQASPAMDWRSSGSPLRPRGTSDASSRIQSSASHDHKAEHGAAAAFSANSKLLKAAMESLETALMASTESAIRRSMAVVEYAIHEELNRKGAHGTHGASTGRHSLTNSKDPQKWTALFPSPNHVPTMNGDESGVPVSTPPTRRSISLNPGRQEPSGTDHRDRAATTAPTTPKETEDASPRPAIEEVGERIHRTRRRMNTHDVPMHFSRRAARHSFANAHLQFSAKV